MILVSNPPLNPFLLAPTILGTYYPQEWSISDINVELYMKSYTFPYTRITLLGSHLRLYMGIDMTSYTNPTLYHLLTIFGNN